jgi:hypothetical protein
MVEHAGQTEWLGVLGRGLAAAAGITVLRKSLRAQEQETGENLWRRQAWWDLVSQVDPACLVFLHENGVTTEMTRR